MNKLTIILPAYNESKNLPLIINDIQNYLINSKIFNYIQTIIVNDCSTDNTKIVIKDLIKKFKNITIINLNQRIGKAYAIDIAIQKSNCDYIAVMDADMQYDVKDIIPMYKLIKDKIIMINGKRIKRKDYAFINYLSSTYYYFLSKIFRINNYDYFSGLKIFNKNIYYEMEYRGLVRFLIFYCLKNNYEIYEYKINHRVRKYGKSTYSFFDRFKLTFADILTLVTCIYFGKKINKIINHSFNLLIIFIIILILYYNLIKIYNMYLTTLYVIMTVAFYISTNYLFKKFLIFKKKNTHYYDKKIDSIES